MATFVEYLERFAEINVIILAIVLLFIGVLMLFGIDTNEKRENPNESYIRAWVKSYQMHLVGLVFVIVAYLAYHARKHPLLKALVAFSRL
jgi:NADH:ubiquinone oxidoreductase subunit 6 (subunit J)